MHPSSQPPEAVARPAEAGKGEDEGGTAERGNQPHGDGALARLGREGGAAGGQVGQKEVRQLEDLLGLGLGALGTGGLHPAVTELPHAAALQTAVPLLAQVYLEGLCLLGASGVAHFKVLVNLADAACLTRDEERYEEN